MVSDQANPYAILIHSVTKLPRGGNSCFSLCDSQCFWFTNNYYGVWTKKAKCSWNYRVAYVINENPSVQTTRHPATRSPHFRIYYLLDTRFAPWKWAVSGEAFTFSGVPDWKRTTDKCSAAGRNSVTYNKKTSRITPAICRWYFWDCPTALRPQVSQHAGVISKVESSKSSPYYSYNVSYKQIKNNSFFFFFF